MGMKGPGRGELRVAAVIEARMFRAAARMSCAAVVSAAATAGVAELVAGPAEGDAFGMAACAEVSSGIFTSPQMGVSGAEVTGEGCQAPMGVAVAFDQERGDVEG